MSMYLGLYSVYYGAICEMVALSQDARWITGLLRLLQACFVVLRTLVVG